MVENPVAGLDSEVQAAAVALEHLDDPERLLVVAEPAAEPLGERLVERFLAGVAERCMAEVVPERDRLGEILVQPEGAGDCRRDPSSVSSVCVRRVR